MMSEGCLDLNAVPNMIKNELLQQETFMEYAEEIAKRRYRSVSPGTKRNYEVVIGFLRSWKGLTYFSDVTERSIIKMDDVLSDKGLKVQTRWNYHKVVKFFIKRAVEDGLVKVNPYSRLDLKRGNENGLTRFLTPAEFHRFESCIIPINSLQKVRDLFVFQTYTMMGYSDLVKFDYKDCFKLNGQIVYKSNRKKTGNEFTFALLQPALNILKKYNYKLPIISNVKYNLYLKSAVTFAHIDKKVSCHWARHTGATMLLNEGKVDINTISKILGDTLRETERTYAKLMDDSIVESMAVYGKRKFGA
jgi:integrase